MIVFDLICLCGYEFEGWFHDTAEYQQQSDTGLILCPKCGRKEVRKILSPVASVSRDSQQFKAKGEASGELIEKKKMKILLKHLRQYVNKNFEDVGSNLATTALKIHYGVEEARNIRGVTTAQEDEMLSQEGISLLKVPLPVEPDDDSN